MKKPFTMNQLCIMFLQGKFDKKQRKFVSTQKNYNYNIHGCFYKTVLTCSGRGIWYETYQKNGVEQTYGWIISSPSHSRNTYTEL